MSHSTQASTLPKTQSEQLRWLYEQTGMDWQISSKDFVDYCAVNGRNELIFVILPVGDMGFYTIYTPHGVYCSYRLEFIQKMKALMQQFPDNLGFAFKYDLSGLPQLVHTEAYSFGTLIATFSLVGDVICYPYDNQLPLTLGFNSHAISINASDSLERFIRTIKAKITHKGMRITNVGLGYSLADTNHEIWNTSITVYPNGDFNAAANPEPIEAFLSDWRVEGQLGFSVSGHWIDRKEDEQQTAESTSTDWENAKEIVKSVSLGAAGVALIIWRFTPIGAVATTTVSLAMALQ